MNFAGYSRKGWEDFVRTGDIFLQFFSPILVIFSLSYFSVFLPLKIFPAFLIDESNVMRLLQVNVVTKKITEVSKSIFNFRNLEKLEIKEIQKRQIFNWTTLSAGTRNLPLKTMICSIRWPSSPSTTSASPASPPSSPSSPPSLPHHHHLQEK